MMLSITKSNFRNVTSSERIVLHGIEANHGMIVKEHVPEGSCMTNRIRKVNTGRSKDRDVL